MASRLGLVIGIANMEVLMRERTTATWKQSHLSQVFTSAALHAVDKAFGVTLPAARFRFPSAFSVLSI